MIEAGRVKVDGHVISRPDHPIDSETETPWSVVGEMKSPIEGASGNVEYLMRLS